ncbi:response regulator [Sphingomonas sp.]|uniref:response regulator n=1 Tax=Sphingomonas sp. TaxID=28214 RepID=UPI003B3B0CB6
MAARCGDATLAVANLLVVDDDAGIRTLLGESLRAKGYVVYLAGDTIEMDRILAIEPIDLIILDVMMPGESGLSACRRLASRDGPPIIILSARGEETDRIIGMELGAGRYLAKPCSPREIAVHVQAALRDRGYGRSGDARRFAGWRIDLASYELFDTDGVLVDLTEGEFKVLRAFVEHPRRVLSRDMLLDQARGPDSESFDRAIDVQVSRLRRKLRARGDEMIRTVRNEGYMFVPDVVRV